MTQVDKKFFFWILLLLKIVGLKNKIKSNGSLEDAFMVLNLNVVIHVETVHISPQQRELKVLSGIGKNMNISWLVTQLRKPGFFFSFLFSFSFLRTDLCECCHVVSSMTLPSSLTPSSLVLLSFTECSRCRFIPDQNKLLIGLLFGLVSSRSSSAVSTQ